MTSTIPAPVDAWYPIAALEQVRSRPLARRLLGRPLVVFRAREGVAVLIDRCPHRGFPLSAGRLRPDGVECPYHGWRFGQDGRCTAVPGAAQPARAGAEVVASCVRDGLVWASIDPAHPSPRPLPTPVGDADQDGFWWALAPSRAIWIEAIENLLDASHPHFVHPGLVRSTDRRQPVRVTVRQTEDSVEAVYDEDYRAAALVPRLIEGLRTRSVGRFFPPAAGQISFEGPQGPRFTLTVVFTPEGEDRVRPFAHFSTPRGVAPAGLKRAVLKLLHLPILAQDRAILARQADALAASIPRPPAIGPLDFLRPAIEGLIKGRRHAPGERVHQAEL